MDHVYLRFTTQKFQSMLKARVSAVEALAVIYGGRGYAAYVPGL